MSKIKDKTPEELSAEEAARLEAEAKADADVEVNAVEPEKLVSITEEQIVKISTSAATAVVQALLASGSTNSVLQGSNPHTSKPSRTVKKVQLGITKGKGEV